MKAPVPPHSRRGSAMILALLLIAVMGVLVAGWLTLMTARSGVVNQTDAAVQRRIALENSKALAQEFLLERVMTSPSGDNDSRTFSLSDAAWGSITVPAWGPAPPAEIPQPPPLLSTNKAAPSPSVYIGYNHFDLGNGDGYTVDLRIVVRDGISEFPRQYQARSRSPLLAGTLLASQTPTLTPTASPSIGAIDVQGAAFVWTPSASMSFTTASYTVPETAATVSFAPALMPSNFALARQIANPSTTGLFYGGQFDAIDNADAAANSSKAKVTDTEPTGDEMVPPLPEVHGSVPDADDTDGITCDGEGNVTIKLATLGLANVYIEGEIATLTLEGQDAANDPGADDLPAILIVVNQLATSTRDLASVILTGHNSRRLDLAIKKAAAPAASLPIQFTTASAAWRLLLEVENTPVALATSGNATIQGGIRSDSTVALSGSLQLTLETDPKYLERLATRTAWIESFAQ